MKHHLEPKVHLHKTEWWMDAVKRHHASVTAECYIPAQSVYPMPPHKRLNHWALPSKHFHLVILQNCTAQEYDIYSQIISFNVQFQCMYIYILTYAYTLKKWPGTKKVLSMKWSSQSTNVSIGLPHLGWLSGLWRVTKNLAMAESNMSDFVLGT